MKLQFDDGALRPIGTAQMGEAARRADGAPRGRAIVRYHEHAESIQRMVHAIEPHSYIRPHKHECPDKTEIFLALRGAAAVCRWSAEGALEELLEIRSDGPRRGVEIPPRVWHSLLATRPGTVLYEVIEGAFDPAQHKEYASWAPEEGSEAGARYHEELRSRVRAEIDRQGSGPSERRTVGTGDGSR